MHNYAKGCDLKFKAASSLRTTHHHAYILCPLYPRWFQSIEIERIQKM